MEPVRCVATACMSVPSVASPLKSGYWSSEALEGKEGWFRVGGDSGGTVRMEESEGKDKQRGEKVIAWRDQTRGNDLCNEIDYNSKVY